MTPSKKDVPGWPSSSGHVMSRSARRVCSVGTRSLMTSKQTCRRWGPVLIQQAPRYRIVFYYDLPCMKYEIRDLLPFLFQLSPSAFIRFLSSLRSLRELDGRDPTNCDEADGRWVTFTILICIVTLSHRQKEGKTSKRELCISEPRSKLYFILLLVRFTNKLHQK